MRAVEPMYATIGGAMPHGADWTFEQKYDGMRVIAVVTSRGIRLVTRNGRDKATQFPDIVEPLAALARQARRTLVLDGEIVAIVRGKPAAFQALQSRMQLKDPVLVRDQASRNPAALMLFDVLQDGRKKVVREPWRDRRARLERILARNEDKRIRLSASSANGDRMVGQARRHGWEGVIAKHIAAPYVPGARSAAWLKLKLQHRAEFVIGGYTEPRRSRPYLGALLLGYFDTDDRLCHVGHIGGGFNRDSLRSMLKRLHPLERRTSPFAERISTNEPAHWVRPTVVVEVKFSEWTADGKLRQPVFLGVRDDKNARDVHKERESIQQWAQEIRVVTERRSRSRTEAQGVTKRRPAGARVRLPAVPGTAERVLQQLEEIRAGGGRGVLQFGRGKTLEVSSLDKPFFPDTGITKGDVMRYYVALSSVLLPIIKDRPLVLKRYPNGIHGQSFFQQNASDNTPDGVRTGRVKTGGGQSAVRIIGGDLLTLLYTVQIGTIAVHTWQSRIQSARDADSATIDLDPGEDVPFADVVELAKNIKVELDKFGLSGAIKTSGSSGLHIVLPLAAGTAFETAAGLADAIATRTAEAYPEKATVERGIRARPPGTIYVDAQQNAQGKSVVAAYSLRERPRATVSAPLDWSELRRSLRLDMFTIESMPVRVAKLGDLWGIAMKRRNSKRAVDRALHEA